MCDAYDGVCWCLDTRETNPAGRRGVPPLFLEDIEGILERDEAPPFSEVVGNLELSGVWLWMVAPWGPGLTDEVWNSG